ncbi:hypothetical protein [Streptomyces sp. NPDC091217]|uniref:hypothetical protein n=1 Tax=Streptomyces sp. NPDC091217 TaxID=3365975 RepID=UPI00382251FB
MVLAAQPLHDLAPRVRAQVLDLAYAYLLGAPVDEALFLCFERLVREAARERATSADRSRSPA